MPRHRRLARGGVVAAAWAALSLWNAAAPAQDAAPPADLPPSAYVFYDAATQGDSATVRSMLADTPSLATLKYKNDVTALHAAALADEPSIVEMLVRRGAFVDARGGQKKVTPLFLAVVKGHARVAEALIAHRADVNVRGALPGDEGADDMRPLHIAAMAGRTDLVDLLVQHGAILTAESSSRETPADYARQGGNPGVSMMLDAYRRMGLVRGKPVAALLRAVNDTDSVAVARVLDTQPALATLVLEGGWTPLHYAAAIGSRPVCDALLARHADPRAQEEVTHWTPALRAYNSGHAELCEYLRRLETEAPRGGKRGR